MKLASSQKDVPPQIGEWTPETIRRFWEYFGKRSDLHGEYFSYQVGSAITNFLAHTGQLRAGVQVLDYGCGPGFLVEKLLARNVRCHGIDSSEVAVDLVNKKFQNRENWIGAIAVSDPPAPFPEGYFDVITCLETLEHLQDDKIPVVLREVYRLLNPGGIALFTTPNEEDLAHSHVFCPFCQTAFHKVQHVRSFSTGDMKLLLETYGFRVQFCRDIDFANFQHPPLPVWKDLSLRAILNWAGTRKNIFLDRIFARPFPNGRDFRTRAARGPHLCALVERPK